MKKRGFFSSKKAQITLFVILGIAIIIGVVIFFLIRTGQSEQPLSEDMKEAHDFYLSCIESHAREGIAILGEQGGYIKIPDFVPGSEYRPFSSTLDFFGQPVPYWYYVSGNNLLKEQAPSRRSMESELADYIKERIRVCDFSDFGSRGYDIFIDEDADIDVSIGELGVSISVRNDFSARKQEDYALVTNHEVSVASKLGKFYNLAMDVYENEKESMFLENYALDVLRLNAPVTGVELTCSPMVFVDENIRENLTNSLSENIAAIKLRGSYYSVSDKKQEYFVTDIGKNIDENVNFIYSPSWTSRIEIYGDRVVEPIGLQEGLAILGFCYVPYHLVYDINFPVLIQFYDNRELFQFPVAVLIEKNNPREALPSIAGTNIESEVCKYNNQDVEIYTYDVNLYPVEANIKFKCLNSICSIGETRKSGEDAVLNAKMPQCVNGFIVANAEGYAEEKYQFSSNEETTAYIVMRKIYNVSLDLGNVDSALVTFKSDRYTAAVLYPEMKDIKLIEDYYNVSVYVYKNSSLRFPAKTERKCINVPKEGIGGFFGVEEEKCFDINFPATEASLAVVGGGKTQEYITEEQLMNSRELNIDIPLFGVPSSLEELNENYGKVEDSNLRIIFE